MPSQQMQDVIELLGAQPLFQLSDVATMRSEMEHALGDARLPAGVTVTEVHAGTRPADWIAMPESDPTRVVLYLHGGGYVMGSRNTHRELATRISREAAARVLLLEYRLAPEHPYPAAVEDATAAYRWLLAQGVQPESMAIAGDSAGGGLTLATLLALRDAGDRLPACAVCLSPWTDLEGTGTSAGPGGADDPMIGVEGLRDSGELYAGERKREPLASPVHADFTGLPPLLLQVGTRELLLDDSTRVAEKARAAGVKVTLEIEEGAYHVWQAMPDLPESVDALGRIGVFVRAYTHAAERDRARA
jgi:monoterpene epsilon-lactone hydrolase